jgi:hypothetical protein
LQNVAAANIRVKSKKGSNYKDVYSETKEAVEGYAQVALIAERLKLNQEYAKNREQKKNKPSVKKLNKEQKTP